ncbi:protein RER1-like isoform X2 [Mercenaria mercenaria]|uniref:protein RER1-like isoform X2 n=1 Tax=Mercenaria mercenaria TaxID=6596 RepID=UPI00234F0988|nr:protein RER1-like isoform X2 [Mercenaria mercenaria]
MEDDIQPSRPNVVKQLFRRIGEIQQGLLDQATPHMTFRWALTLVLFILYFLRVYLLQGWYIVTYALGIYLLNLFIGFLTPKIDPSLNMDSDDGPELPTRSSDEFKPFMRRLPEFKFWYSGTKAVCVATFCTFFEAFNIPVFWPILVMYFIILFVITMKRQIKHMIRHKYVPWSGGKTKYKGKEDTGKVVVAK